jgi:hypothetical protein
VKLESRTPLHELLAAQQLDLHCIDAEFHGAAAYLLYLCRCHGHDIPAAAAQ